MHFIRYFDKRPSGWVNIIISAQQLYQTGTSEWRMAKVFHIFCFRSIINHWWRDGGGGDGGSLAGTFDKNLSIPNTWPTSTRTRTEHMSALCVENIYLFPSLTWVVSALVVTTCTVNVVHFPRTLPTGKKIDSLFSLNWRQQQRLTAMERAKICEQWNVDRYSIICSSRANIL